MPGTDRTVGPGSVQLDGNASSDAEGGDLTYAWTFASSDPSGTTVTLTGGDTAQPTFTAPNTAVALTFSLTVTDEAGNASTADTVVITVDTSRPSVDAGDDVTVGSEVQVMLNGSGASSTGGGVTYEWSQAAGNPSTLNLSSNTAATPTFTSPSTTGTYTLTLTVTDTGTSVTASDTITILVDATAPTAEAGPARAVSPGASVTLDGSGSTDPQGDDALTYAWALTASDPTATLADLSRITTTAPTFTAPGTAGTLTFTLTVTDGGGNEATDTVIITVDAPPTAEAGAHHRPSPRVPPASPWTALAPPIPRMTGRAHRSPIAGPSPTAIPSPRCTLTGGGTASPTFTAPGTAGTLTFTLTVRDSAGNEHMDTVTITMDPAPVANAGSGQTVGAGSEVTLRGSASSDTDAAGDTFNLTYSWALTGDPDGTAGRPWPVP